MSLAADIAKRMLARRTGTATAKAPVTPPPRPVRVAIAAHKPAQAVAKVGTPVAERLRSAPAYVPPRSEPDLVEVYRSLPEVFGPVADGLPVTTPTSVPGRARGSCKAVDAATGRQCKLPHHPEHPEQHRHERGMFHRVAAPGTTTFPLREALELAALASPGAGGGLFDRKGSAIEKRESRTRIASRSTPPTPETP